MSLEVRTNCLSKEAWDRRAVVARTKARGIGRRLRRSTSSHRRGTAVVRDVKNAELEFVWRGSPRGSHKPRAAVNSADGATFSQFLAD